MKEYFKLKKINQRRINKQLDEIEKILNQFGEIIAGQNLIIEELQKDSYKEKFRKEHKKRKEQEKEFHEIINELTNEIKELRKGDK